MKSAEKPEHPEVQAAQRTDSAHTLEESEHKPPRRHPAQPDARQDILNVQIEDDASLQSAYMPFVTGGGLFIPAEGEFTLGQEVFVMLSLQDLQEPLPIAGKVIWVTPENAGRDWMRGIGLQFSDDDQEVRELIESRLALGDFVENPSATL